MLLPVTKGRGGNYHPICVREFILNHLRQNGSDYPANIHRAYKKALDELAKARGKKQKYHKPTYQSFALKFHLLAREGLIKFTGQEEVSDNPKFEGKDWKPVRHYYSVI